MYSPGSYDSLYAGNMGLNPNRQEPMALGTISPGGSPSSIVTNQYLPNFLIGDSTTGFAPSSPRIWSMAGSPNKQRRSLNVSPPSPMMQAGSLHQSGQIPSNQTPNRYGGRLPGEKPNGPPVTGLFESMNSPNTVGSRNASMLETSYKHNESLPTSPGMNRSTSLSLYDLDNSKLYSSPAQLDPFYTQRDSLTFDGELDESWITVFGFPAAAASYILQQFSQYGMIVEYKIEAGGNWMHLHYQSKLQAKKALSKNGKVYGGSVMIGVKPCIEKKMMDESAKENSILNTSCSSKFGDDNRSMTSIRPLTQAYKVSSSERDVIKPTRTPQKSSNLISKTMDYMFGW